MLSKKLFILVLVFCYLPLTTQALPTDKNQPAAISANSAELNQILGTSQFNGNVIITQGTTKITANQITTFSNKKQKLNKAIALGSPAIYQTIPKAGDKVFEASAKKIEYLPTINTVILIGNGELEQAGNLLKSDYIVYNQKTGQVTTKSINNNRTTIIIQPKQTS
jgi:lipopolysaccharide export system protein LptA